ncbi:MAG: hypothetical protein IAF94_07210 [Pirellulaceae bacterium]|nr:hypothetical protein [Pirellulaceae bacterium]
MKFSIRDLLWLTVVVALTLGWVLDHRRLSEKAKAAELKAQTAELFASSAEHLARMLDRYGWHMRVFPDGTIAGIQDAGAP